MIVGTGKTYCISIWDHETDGWELREASVPWRDLPDRLRTLWAEGWSHFSYLIEEN
jgi:hypothetical protein